MRPEGARRRHVHLFLLKAHPRDPLLELLAQSLTKDNCRLRGPR